ncbi:hypothetical protein AVL48_16560 [Amycolatopsis regifaucium]|uniref:Uncharacterized protein n=1 Tax=Amycolatopsis regifaucium TaxID=546365 RepID=A0A154M3M5_9PSEU|nr:hypothetical protein AVL48_16560 [Amycolatopsis regifaucium]OKA07395.1 hypothetical protein ATP06_0216240 [Amycolatopsis regifaucium]
MDTIRGRQAVAVNHRAGGPEVADRARSWAADLVDGQGPLTIDRTSVPELSALQEVGVEMRYGQSVLERAGRAVFPGIP